MIRAILTAVLFFTISAAAEPASPRFESQRDAARGSPTAIGTYTNGCLIGGVRLREDGPFWAAMRPARNRAWGHPKAAEFIAELGARSAAVGLPGLLIGDIGLPRGGPFTTGHRSHQVGLDIDIWMRPMDNRPSTAERDSISSYDVVEGRSTLRRDLWNRSSAPAIRIAAEMPQVQRIFVHPVIKRELCATATGDRAWLSKVRPWWGHDAHFHVRLHCPPGSPGCVPQQEPAGTDGCGAELAWWFTDEPYSGSSAPKPRLALAELPAQCRALVDQE